MTKGNAICSNDEQVDVGRAAIRQLCHQAYKKSLCASHAWRVTQKTLTRPTFICGVGSQRGLLALLFFGVFLLGFIFKLLIFNVVY
ncbi:MAG: hypothetical protein ACOY4D_10650 [Pseudomonadota bacterium]